MKIIFLVLGVLSGFAASVPSPTNTPDAPAAGTSAGPPPGQVPPGGNELNDEKQAAIAKDPAKKSTVSERKVTPLAELKLFEGFQIDYPKDNITTLENNPEGGIVFNLFPAKNPKEDAEGARISSLKRTLAGKGCAEIKIEKSISGTIFAIYATTSEPEDRKKEKWNELDVEFTGQRPKETWINAFFNGEQKDIKTGKKFGFYKDLGFEAAAPKFTKYCIEWDMVQSKKAVWTIDDKEVHQFDLNGWSKPLQFLISFWGSDKFPKFAGNLELKEKIRTIVKSVTFDTKSEDPKADIFVEDRGQFLPGGAGAGESAKKEPPVPKSA